MPTAWRTLAIVSAFLTLTPTAAFSQVSIDQGGSGGIATGSNGQRYGVAGTAPGNTASAGSHAGSMATVGGRGGIVTGPNGQRYGIAGTAPGGASAGDGAAAAGSGR